VPTPRRPPPSNGRPRPTLRFRIVAWLVILLVHVARWRPRTTGLEHVPATGGAVITWNHHGHVDFVLTAWDVYRRLGRPVRYLAMRELWDSHTLGWVPRFADAIPVSRTSDGDRDRALADAVAALRDGHLVMVAPEGGISESLELGAFRTGAARMAQLAGVPLVPSASWGSHRLSTTGHPFSLRRAFGVPVEVAFGAPLDVPPDEDATVVTAALRARTADLLEEVRDRYPDGAPAGAWWVPARLGGGAPPADPDRPAVRLPRSSRTAT
jgi:1-acyl-sn-glycerol-3-phosphate acyltransferase